MSVPDLTTVAPDLGTNGNPKPQEPEMGDHRPDLDTALTLIRARILTWEAKQENQR